MKCPACDRSLSQLTAGGIELDVCSGGCGGVWFDDREIKKFDDRTDIDATPVLSLPTVPQLLVDANKIRYCPKCPEEELCRRFYDLNRRIEVDQCLHCSGIWLDVGELKEIRAQFATQEERQAAGDRYLEGQLERTEELIEVDSARRLVAWERDVAFTGTLKHLFRFFLGSY